jgi:vacuolar-type H+-ATPase subunit E/Vma4
MAIEDILAALDKQSEADIVDVIDEAKAHAALILNEAEDEAVRIHNAFARQVERTATTEAAKIVNAARLESKMTVSSARGGGMNEVFETAADALGRVRSSSGYSALFGRLADEALAGIDGEVVVRVDPADKSLAEAKLRDAGVAGTVETDISTAGGLVVELAGGRIIRRNTLEDRLERVRQYVQGDVAKALYA